MYPDIPPAIQLPPEQQRRFLFNAFREFLERAAGVTPIVHVLEDLHWADEPTLLLLQHLGPILSTSPILLIGTYRDVELEVTRPFAKTLETMLRQKQATRISLRRLAVDGVESMLGAMSGQTPPPWLARVVFDETEGNPFFVEEVFRHLAEEGKLFDESGKWRPGLRADQLQVPEGVRLVLGRRLDRLGEDARRTLTTAAVMGRSFSLPLLEALENAQPDAALDAVEEAERAHLVIAESATSREARYRFVHELVRQTLAETLSMPRRQRLHARIADAIEKLYGANLEAHSSALAHHLYQAGAASDPEKTANYLILAAKQARAGAAHEEALTHLENALSLWEGEKSLRVAELTEKKAEVLRSLGRTDDAVKYCNKAIAMYESSGASVKAAQASYWLAIVLVWSLEFPAAAKISEKATDCLGAEEPDLRRNLLAVAAASLGCSGDVTGAARLIEELNGVDDHLAVHSYLYGMQYERSANMASRVAEAELARGDMWAAAESMMCTLMHAYCGRPTQTAQDLSEIVRLAEKIGHHDVLLICKCFLIVLATAQGDLRQAQRDAEAARNFGEQHGLGWTFLAEQLKSINAYLRGDFREAERWYCHREEPLSHMSGIAEANLFALWAEAGDERALGAWTQRRWKLPRAGELNPNGAWIALAASVIGLASLGRRDEAAELRPLTEELVRTGAWIYPPYAFRTVAGIAAACAGDWPAAEEHHLTAIHQMDTAPYRTAQPMAREWYARMLLDRNAPGDATKARDLLTEALAMYESIGMPFHASRTRLTMEKL